MLAALLAAVDARYPSVRRLGRGALLLLVLLSVLAVAAERGLNRAGAGVTAPPAPDWGGASGDCRRGTLDHVHNPTRLIVVARCSTITGAVQSIRYDPRDGDWELQLTPDSRYARSLPSANRGVLIARVIPTDLGRVSLPLRGERVALYGAWVLNKNRRRIAEMHPTWGIRPLIPRAARARRPALPLRLSVRAPASRTVGDIVPVRLHTSDPARRPEPQAHLFIELTAAGRGGVDWKAAITNTLGAVTVNLLALHVPGVYTINVYADKRGRQAVARVPLTIRRRARPASCSVCPRGSSPKGG